MDLIYKIDWPFGNCKLGHNAVNVCAWSSSNLFAFTTEKIVKEYRKQYINVLCPNQPWDVFTIIYTGGEIVRLQWDQTGSRFLTGDSEGVCCVWSMVNNMSNVWSSNSKHNADVQGEEILALDWLHTGNKVLFHIDKLDVTNLHEKFDRAKFRPTVVQFGGKSMDGYVLVTGSGLLHVQIFLSESETVSGESYLNFPCHQKLADIKCTNQGKIVVLTSNGDIHHCIHFYELELKYDRERKKLSFSVCPLPSLALKLSTDENIPYTHLLDIRFLPKENIHYVLVCMSGPTGSQFESWMMKESAELHRSSKSNASTSAAEVTKSWRYVTKSNELPKVLCFSFPSLPMDSSSNQSRKSQDYKFYCGLSIAVALADNTVQILHSLFLQTLGTLKPPENLPSQVNTEVTGSKPRARICSATYSTLSCALIAADENGSLMLYKIPPWLNEKPKTLQPMKQIIHMLMYCLITGRDWWDVLLHMSYRLVDNLIEQLVIEMKKQPEPLQQILKCRFLSMKITIYQISNSSLATDCHFRLLFDAVALVFRSMVRPPQQVTTEENDPAVKLQLVSRTSNETDINNLIQNVDTEPQSLLSLQQLIQWVADVTLYLLASVPYQQLQKQVSRPCSTLVHDHEWLTLLREMLVLIRVWGLLKQACSPVFHVLDLQLEILPHAFRLITLLWQACASEDTRATDIPKTLVNECCLLPSQVIIPPLETISAVNGVLNHMRLSMGNPSLLTFGQPQYDVSMNAARFQQTEFVAVPGSSGKIDALRRIYLGKRPNQELKECTRCGITAMYNNFSRSALKVWDQRFVKSCLCGGLWKKIGVYD